MRAASSIPEYEEAENAFMSMHGYKDADKYAEECQNEINRLSKQKRLAEQQNTLQKRNAEGAAGKWKILVGILAVTAVLCTIAVLIVSKVRISDNVSKKEMELLAQAEVGSTVQFGSFEQDNNMNNGKEPVEWIVLEKNGNGLLVISKNALACKPYNESNTGITWASSSLRKWLNSSFMQEAFSDAESSLISSTDVKAEKNPLYDSDPGADTQDRVFLLSISEAEKYFGSVSQSKCTCSAYATAQGAYSDSNGKCWWWLRSPGFTNSRAAYINLEGQGIVNGNSIDTGSGCVRPALWINLDT